MKDELPSDLPELPRLKIRAELLQIHDSIGPQRKDTKTCLSDAYNVFARVLSQAGEVLDESLLREKIPARVFQWAVARKWLPYPPRRLRQNQKNKDFLGSGKYNSTHEAIPEAELTVPFGVYMVNEDYKARILGILESSIAYWIAEAANQSTARAFRPDFADVPRGKSSWDGLRLGFMQLQSDCAIDPPVKPAGRLTAIWTSHPEPAGWRLDHWGGKDGNGVKRRFEWHAQSAAARLRFVGGGDAAVSYWLDQLKQDAPDSHIRKQFIASEGADHLYSVEILDICGLSAEYCRKCEAEEIRSRVVFYEKDSVALGPKATLLGGQSAPNAGEEVSMFQRDANSRPLQKATPASEPRHVGTTDASPKNHFTFAVQDWQDVEIRFVSDERIQLTAGKQTETRNYAEFGFEDRRSEKPKLAWVTLRTLAQKNGTLGRPSNGKNWKTVEKRMQEIRKVFRRHFRLTSDPIPFVDGTGYRTQFKITCASSFES